MYALQTVGSTTSSVKDDTEVLELDDAGNSIAEQIITNSNAVKRSGNLTANGYPSSQSHPVSHSKYEHDNDDESNSVGLCYWTIFQAVGLTCVAVIICRSIVYQQGFFDSTNQNGSTSINKRQFSNWHFSLTTVGFVYLYANSVFLIKDKKSSVTLPYVMLHTFAAIVSALGLYAMYFDKEIGKSPDAKFYEGHLYSIHSWTGALAAAMFAVQWLSAIFTFMMPCLRAVGLPLGKMFSLYTVMVSTIALACGVNEHAVKALKEEYKSYSIESLILNGFTMLVVLFLFLIAFNIIKTYRK